MWNMRVMVIPIVVCALGTVLKGFGRGLEELEIRGRIETIHITVLIRFARILETRKDLAVTQTPV